MAERRPIVLIGGTPRELPAGDTLPGGGPVAGIFYPCAQVLGANLTLAAGQNYLFAGRLTLADGVRLEVEDGVRVVMV